MKRVAAIAALIAAGLLLAGCSTPPLEDRIAERDACQAAGGVFDEWWGDFGNYWSRCDLSDAE